MSKLRSTIVPKDDDIPLTIEELQKLNFRYCYKEVLAHNECLLKAKQKFLKLGKNSGAEWGLFHLGECFDFQDQANQCIIRERKDEIKFREELIEDLEAGYITAQEAEDRIRKRKIQIQLQQQQHQNSSSQQTTTATTKSTTKGGGVVASAAGAALPAQNDLTQKTNSSLSSKQQQEQQQQQQQQQQQKKNPSWLRMFGF